jgi:exodeoxyribonuclease VII small subunit
MSGQRAAAGEAGEGFDRVIERLRGVVEKLEAGSLSLEESLAAFEEGVRLSRRGTEILDQAERRVEMLTRGEGGEQVVPFVAPGEGEGGQ